MMSPSPQYEIFKATVEAAKQGNPASVKFIRSLLERVAKSEETPDYALIALGECLLRLREDDCKRN